MLFERTAISKKPDITIKNDLLLLQAENKMSPDLFYRDPYILDFLGLKDTYSEKDLENSILAEQKEIVSRVEKSQQTIELLELDRENIRVGQYLTKMPPKDVLEQKLLQAIENAKSKGAN